MEVERLTAVLEASGLASFSANMATADRVTGGTKDQLKALAEVSKVATEALKHVKLTAAQAMESKVSAESILQGVKGIGEEARQAARDLDRVHLSQAQATETRLVADEQVRSLKKVEDQAIKTRAAQGGGGGGGMGAMGLMAGAIGGAALITPAAGPGVLGLLAAIPVLATTGAGALGTLMLAFQGVTKAVMGNKKAFDGLVPEAQQFVLTIRSLDGWFRQLKETAGKAMFPGLTEGLHAALSPGTVAAITTAVTEFGHAIGEAGKMWGQYFGSSQFRSIFGPLMKAGAQNFSLMADTALHLFDAIGVLGRAAIPLVSWMVKGVDAASRWADSFVKAKDATGGLNGAMNEAKSSLQLVGNLFAALAKAVYELGAALYPVSKVAVKDLTDGLNWLAEMFKRNRKEIQDIVGGALAALVATIKNLLPVVTALIHALEWVAKTMGGWKTAFEIVLSGYLAFKFIALGKTVYGFGSTVIATTKKVAGLRLAFLGLGDNMVLGALGAVAIAVAAVIASSGSAPNVPGVDTKKYPLIAGGVTPPGIVEEMKKLEKKYHLASDMTVGAAVKKSPGFAAALEKWIESRVGSAPITGTQSSKVGGGFIPSGQSYIEHRADQGRDFQTNPGGGIRAPGDGYCVRIGYDPKGFGPDYPIVTFTTGEYKGKTMYIGHCHSTVAPGEHFRAGDIIAKTGTSGVGNATVAGWGEIGYAPGGSPGPFGQSIPFGSQGNIGGTGPTSTPPGTGGTSSPFGTPPPFTTGLGPQTTAKQRAAAAARALAAKLQIPVTNDQTLVAHYASLAASANTGPEIAKYLDDEAAALKKENVALLASMQGKTAAQDAKIKQTISKNQDIIAGLHEAMVQALDMSKDESAFAKFQAKLKTLTAKFTADSDYATVLTGQVAADYQNVIRKDLLNQAAVLTTESASLKSQLIGATGKRKTEIQAKLTSITSSLDTVQGQILSSLQSTVTTLQGKVSTLFSAVQSQIDAAFQAQTQAMIDQLGTKFMQNGGQTPGEAQLAAMQAQDALQSQLDSIQQAKDQLSQDQGGSLTGVVYDAATGITKNIYNAAAAKQIAADQKNLDAANRQYDEYMLGIKAADERLAADTAYATQLKALQDSRTAAETALNQQISDLSDAFQNGVGSMQALSDIAARYGIQITLKTIPDFDSLSSASGQLAAAFQILVDWITKIDGIAPKIPTDSSGAATAGGGGTGLGGSTGPGAVLQDLHNQVVAGILSPADYNYLISGHKLNIPGMASGGIVRAKPGGTLVRLAEAGQDEQVGPVGGGGGGATSITVNVSGSVLTEGDLVDAIYAGLLRKRNRNGGKLNLN